MLETLKVGNNNSRIGSIELGEMLKKRYEENLAAKQAILQRKTESIPDFTITDAELAAKKESLQLQIEMEGERVRKQYGTVSYEEISRILRAEKEIAVCEGCKGLPCPKRKNQGFTPKIYYDELYGLDIRNVYCDYEKARQLQLQIERLTGLSKIPAEYLGKTFEDYQVDASNAYAVKVAKKLVELPNNGAYFFGGVGTGKTFLAAILAQEVIKQGRQVIFATVPTISMKIRSTFSKTPKRNSASEVMTQQAPTEEEILEKLMTVPTLILDDVGMEKPTRFVCSTLCNVFNERYNARLQTIMTSNYPLKQLENIFNNPSDGGATLDGTRIYDRCKQMCVPVEFKGKSRRN